MSKFNSYFKNVVNEAYVKPLNEEVGTRGTLYVLILKEDYEGEYVLGIYNSLDLAKKAYKQYIQEDGDSTVAHNMMVKAVSLNTPPSFSYISNSNTVVDRESRRMSDR